MLPSAPPYQRLSRVALRRLHPLRVIRPWKDGLPGIQNGCSVPLTRICECPTTLNCESTSISTSVPGFECTVPSSKEVTARKSRLGGVGQISTDKSPFVYAVAVDLKPAHGADAHLFGAGDPPKPGQPEPIRGDGSGCQVRSSTLPVARS